MKPTIDSTNDGRRSAGGIAARAGRAWRGLPSFTLIETLVAVGALAFIATGIAVIFEATGKTVTTGKRVSAFNTYAAAIELQLRTDFASMTRDGFLVIRNEYAEAFADDNPAPIQVYDGDTRPRLRRTDELMFFAKGKFTSARPPVVPGVVAKADAAQIYYGHGQRWRPDNSQQYKRPAVDQVTTDYQTQLGYVDTSNVVPNPNRYASDWTLLRHVTLLCPPQAARTAPASLPTGLTTNNIPDSDAQVALQPAAANIFRSLAAVFPAAPTGNELHSMGGGHPAIASGLIDIATTDLAEIRSVVLTADVGPDPALVGPGFFGGTGSGGARTNVIGTFKPGYGTGVGLAMEQAWMDDALPAWSHAQNPTNRYRLRYEPAPPDFAGVLENVTAPVIPAGVQQDLARADQVMLSSSNFVPHCTEFIVEWSFGDVYPLTNTKPDGTPDLRYRQGYEGETIWHGLQRLVADPTGARIVHELTMPYREDNVSFVRGFDVIRNNGTLAPPPTGIVTSNLIHGVNATQLNNWQKQLPSYFGYIDPTFNPDMDPPPAGNGVLSDPKDAVSATLPWMWPKMIRVTMSLTDPNDPSFERTFQFVFDVPQVTAN
jgi:hypothetical protein